MQRKESKLIPQKLHRCPLGLLLLTAIIAGCQYPQISDRQTASRAYRHELYGAKSQQPASLVTTDAADTLADAGASPAPAVKKPSERIVRAQSTEVLDYDGFDSSADSYNDATNQYSDASEEQPYDRGVQPAQYAGQPTWDDTVGPIGAGDGYLPPPAANGGIFPGPTLGIEPVYGNRADVVIDVDETTTGRFQFGVGINSDAGATAQVVIDEQNFDWRRIPTSWDEVLNGTAFRGGGQRLRIEAIPGNQLQRYLVNFTEPYLFDTPISLNLSAFLYDRRFFDWDEQRLGGRLGLGYRLNHDLSIAASIRAEQVDITDPRVRGVPELERALGESDLFGGKLTLTHDTRNSAFAPSEGQYIEMSFEQVFGDFNYPRAGVDVRRYFLLTERIDGTGKHVLGTSLQAGFSGSDTPVYENYFAGGYSTLRGFRFRGASPKSGDVIVGGEFSLLGSTEYIFPITADEMLRGVVFADYGTIEEQIEINGEDFRVAVGFGLRISVPGLGFGAPIAVDFAIPVNRESTDRIQNFSFFMGVGR